MGKVIDGYEIIRTIGEGGMGIVYLARDVLLGRDVALKVLKFPYQSDEKVKKRFVLEAELAAGINHSNVVTVFKRGVSPPYFAMQYVSGGSLKSLIEQSCGTTVRPVIEFSEIVRISLQVSSALAEAHRRNIIHRDIKPANILFDASNNVLVTDFGIAKAVSSLNLTMCGQVIGTPEYMSPEQAKGQPDITGASDIFSYGITMYEMVSGVRPFTGRKILEPHGWNIPSLSDLVPGMDYELDKIIMCCLEHDPGNRYENGEELHHALKEYGKMKNGPPARIQSPTVKERQSGSLVVKKSRHPKTVFLLPVVMILVVLSAVLLWRMYQSKSEDSLHAITVYVNSSDTAFVFIDEVRVGKTPFSGTVTPGLHFISIQSEMLTDTTVAINVSGDTGVNIPLKRIEKPGKSPVKIKRKSFAAIKKKRTLRSFQNIQHVFMQNVRDLRLICKEYPAFAEGSLVFKIRFGVNGLGQVVFCEIIQTNVNDEFLAEEIVQKILKLDFGMIPHPEHMDTFIYTLKI